MNDSLADPLDAGPTLFLLTQIGACASKRFEDKTLTIGLANHHVGILRMIGVSPGLSQRDLGGLLGLSPSALVWLIDELENKNLIRRQEDPNDRRAHALYLSVSGKQILAKLKNLAASEQHGLLECLSAAEREQLNSMLKRIADHHGLKPGVHPRYKTLAKRAARRRGVLHQ